LELELELEEEKEGAAVGGAGDGRGRGTRKWGGAHLVVNVAADPGHEPPLGVRRERRESALLQTDSLWSD
jgi:hypothetical protein